MKLPCRKVPLGAIAACALLSLTVVACGDDSEVEDGGPGGGGATSSGTTSSTSSSTTQSSSSGGEGGNGTGGNGTGGNGTGGNGTGGNGTGGNGTGGNGTGGNGTGGSGTGGAGGGTNAWTAPDCETIQGTAAVTFTSDEGDTVAARAQSLSGVAYASSVIALDTPNTLLVANAGMLQRSTDAGCTFEDVGALPSEAFAKLVPASGGKAYGYCGPEAALFAIEGDAITDLSMPGAASPIALVAFPEDAEHLRLADSDGALWESTDGGDTWGRLGASVAPDGCTYTAQFDPSDLDHVVCGTATTGTWITTDAGDTWTRATSDVLWSQTFTVTISPVDGNVVWIEGYENGLHNGETVGIDQRHIWRSTDGGASFTTVLLEDAEVEGDVEGARLYNGNVLAAHPTDPDVLYYLYGIGPQFEPNFGAIFRVEASTGDIHVEAQIGGDIDDYGSIAFSPADPDILYLSLTSERPSEG